MRTAPLLLLVGCCGYDLRATPGRWPECGKGGCAPGASPAARAAVMPT